MQIDSSPLIIAARLDNGMTDRPELTWMIDLATRTIPAAVLRPSAGVDAALLLARCLTPEPMRPGWADALRMSRSVLPHLRLAGIDQRLADEWLVSTWQNRPHDGLRDPLTPGRALTPNEKYAALVEAAGYVPVPLSQNDYIELLPVEWRAINAYGVKIRHRKYQSKALRRYSREPSGVKARKDLWEVHRDPYDVSRIWVRNHRDGGWIEATWTTCAPARSRSETWPGTTRRRCSPAGASTSPPRTRSPGQPAASSQGQERAPASPTGT